MHREAELLAAAEEARGRAYVPYSNFAVGAALLTHTGEIVAAANVENASYGLSMCAERSAVFAAFAAGFRRFEAIAIAGPPGVAISPCGACRQVLFEFGDDVLVVRRDRETLRVGELLPDGFGPASLEGAR